MTNVDIPDKFLPEDHKVVGYEGPDYDHLVVFVSEDDRNNAMVMADFRREQLTRDEPYDPGDYCVIPADEDGELLLDDEKVGKRLKGVWGYNPFTE